MQIKWLEDAVYDLTALRQYIAEDNPLAANQIANHIVSAVNLLTDQPSLGRPGRVPHTRELVITSTPFIAPYRVKNNTLEVLRIFHGAMQWPDKL